MLTSGEAVKVIECTAMRPRTRLDMMDLKGSASRVGGTLLGAVLAAGGAWAQTGSSRTPSPPGAQIYFETPTDGQHVFSPLTVSVGLHGMAVAPAATMIPGTGNHHLLIDTKLGPLNEPLPVSNQVVHVSNGETEFTIGLSPGWHTLQLVLADGKHMNLDPPVMSKPIRIFVKRH